MSQGNARARLHGTTGRQHGAPMVHGPRMGGRGGIEKARDPRGALKRLAAYLRRYAVHLVGVVGLVAVASLLDILAPYLLGLAIDRFIASGDAAGLLRISLVMFGTYVTARVAQFGQQYVMVGITQRVLRALRGDLFDHLQTLSLSFFDQHTSGELMSRLTNDVDAIQAGLSHTITETISALLSVAGIVIAMFLLNFWLALGGLVVVLVMLWLTTAVARRTRRGFREVQAGLGQMNTVMEENISGARVVEAFGRQGRAVADFQQANIRVRDASIRAQSLAMMLPPLLMVLGNLHIAVIGGLGGWLALRDLVSVGIIATFVVYARRFFRPLRSLAELFNTAQSGLAGAERVFDVLDRVPVVRDRPDATELEEVKGQIEFDGVNFEYVRDVPVLTEVSFSIKPGQMTALVGPTGAGKTTIVSLVSRLYDVTQGAIRIDGHDVRDLKQDWLRRQMGVVLQDTFLFSETVMENIRYGRLDATDEECVAAAHLANAPQFIERLPQGYQTPLSERASNLSEGQRQLLSIARAALADPAILILDEATSSVDTRTEVGIHQALLKLMEGRTTLVIAHRLSTIRNADVVLVIDQGRIIERGTHDELLARRGFYHDLYMSQFRREEMLEQPRRGSLES
ncbi:MAG: ABC transporter ATP-binding protein [Anaerolineales bacterium]|nr:MAG: ABC transporter ATP-binding protein [Anaerolineales bacterium]